LKEENLSYATKVALLEKELDDEKESKENARNYAVLEKETLESKILQQEREIESLKAQAADFDFDMGPAEEID
jgi:hypothetical protein